MSINFSKSCCLCIGPRCNIPVVGVDSLSGQSLPWVNEMRYLGVYIVRSGSMKCSLDACKRFFYSAATSIFGKIGRTALEEVVLNNFIHHKSGSNEYKNKQTNITKLNFAGCSCPTVLQLISTKCIPILLYGFSLYNYQ